MKEEFKTRLKSLHRDLNGRNAELQQVEKTLADAQTEERALQSELDCAVTELIQTHADADALPESLRALAAERDNTCGQRDHAKAKLDRLEKLAGLSGVDASKAVRVPGEADTNNSPSGCWAQYEDLRKKEKAGSIAPGSARKFWTENKAALQKYADSHRAGG
jgi:septal ring factor EnvC (AmiA/AmiB activator)